MTALLTRVAAVTSEKKEHGWYEHTIQHVGDNEPHSERTAAEYPHTVRHSA